MKKFIVFDGNYSFVGVLDSAVDAELFKQQRNMNYFKVEVMTEKEILKIFGEKNELDERTFNNYEGYIASPEEEIYMFASLDQLELETRMNIEDFLKNMKPFIKFDNKEERDTVIRFLQHMYEVIDKISGDRRGDDLYDDEGELTTEIEYNYNLGLLVRDTIRQFGAKL